eukprot:5678026-Prymnesium_polylepis.1
MHSPRDARRAASASLAVCCRRGGARGGHLGAPLRTEVEQALAKRRLALLAREGAAREGRGLLQL